MFDKYLLIRLFSIISFRIISLQKQNKFDFLKMYLNMILLISTQIIGRILSFLSHPEAQISIIFGILLIRNGQLLLSN